MEKTKERGEKNAMHVTFVPPTRRCDTQSFFLKQPVAEASINSDPLTLPVPVNGGQVRQAASAISCHRMPAMASRDSHCRHGPPHCCSRDAADALVPRAQGSNRVSSRPVPGNPIDGTARRTRCLIHRNISHSDGRAISAKSTIRAPGLTIVRWQNTWSSR